MRCFDAPLDVDIFELFSSYDTIDAAVSSQLLSIPKITRADDFTLNPIVRKFRASYHYKR